MLVISHLTKHYAGGKGVTDLSLHIEKGDLCAFIGRNGAGKTTTLKAVTGIHSFDAGEILIGGESIRENPLACKRKFAYIPDNPDVYEYLTGMQYLNFIGDIFAVPVKERRERIRRYGEKLEITEALGELVSSYSHGMKQKLAIVSALIHEPELLILDEPFVGLDPKAVFTLKEIMRGLCEAGGAVFFSTHVLEVAEKLCNKAAIIRDGQLVRFGKMEELVSGDKSLESLFMEVTEDAGTAETSHKA